MSQRKHTDALEVELIRTMFDSFAPGAVMTACFALAGSLAVARTGDGLLLALVLVGFVASTVRLTITWRCGRAIRAPDLSAGEARALQNRFAIPYYGFAVVLGLVCARAFRLPHSEVHMMMICLLVGYAAGVAASMGLRPHIANPSMTMAVVPTSVSALVTPDLVYWATSLLLVVLLIAGVTTVDRRYAIAVQSIGRRIAFASLARSDALTELPNRLGLREWYNEHVAFGGAAGTIAVHYLDLNGFKPVNDTHGHPVGDALLTAVGQRLARTIRQTDIAARLGGDEFVVIQLGIVHREEATSLAERLCAAIARPYQIGDRRVKVSACVGLVVAADGEADLDHLLERADQALYAAKRDKCSIVDHEELLARSDRAAA